MTTAETARGAPAPSGAAPAAGDAALRAEHDALGEQLATRRSIDWTRKALYLVFVGLLSAGLTVKLAWDRWGVLKPGVIRKLHGGRPAFLMVATAVSIVLLSLAIRAFARARRLMAEEDAAFARYRGLRQRLGLDA